MIIIPDKVDVKSPPYLTDDGSHLVFGDVLDNLHEKWKKVLDELVTMKNISEFSSSDFERLVHVVCGLWSVGPTSLRKMWSPFSRLAESLVSQFITPVYVMKEDADFFKINFEGKLKECDLE